MHYESSSIYSLYQYSIIHMHRHQGIFVDYGDLMHTQEVNRVKPSNHKYSSTSMIGDSILFTILTREV